MKPLAALGFAALLLAACQRSHSPVAAAQPAPSAPAGAANLAEATANVAGPPLPADVDPDNPYAVFAARAAAAKAAESKTARIDYGVLGDPLDSSEDWEEHDWDFFSQTTRQKLDLFRDLEHPNPTGRPMNWDELEAISALQRALYYAVLKDAPALITDQDRKALKAADDELIFHACADRGAAGTLFDIPEKDCPPALRHLSDR